MVKRVAAPPEASEVQMLPNNENAKRSPSGDQVGSVAPKAVESESAADAGGTLAGRTATQANSSNKAQVAIRTRCVMPGL